MGDCLTQSYTIRTVLQFASVPTNEELSQGYVDALAASLSNLLEAEDVKNTVLIEMTDGSQVVTLNALFEYKDQATAALNSIKDLNETQWSAFMSPATVEQVVWASRLYRYTTGTTRDFQGISPSGLEVINTFFDPACNSDLADAPSAGCWVIDILYTTGGPESLNVLYLPRTVPVNAEDWDGPGGTTLEFPLTEFPEHFPCGSLTKPLNGGLLALQETSCCMHEFFNKYRTNAAFESFLTDAGVTTPSNPFVKEQCKKFAFDDFTTNNFNVASGDLVIGDGKFYGLDHSMIINTGIRDSYLNQYTAQIRLDERELRRYAAKRAGTIGAQYTLDFYIGIAEFKPTDTYALDSAMKQVPIHLEKSDFFTVSTYSFVGASEEKVCCGEVGGENGAGCQIDLYGNAFCPPDQWNISCMDWLVVDSASLSPGQVSYCCEKGFQTAEQELACATPGTPQNCVDFYDSAGNFWVVPKNVNGTYLSMEESPWNVTVIGPNAANGEGACCIRYPNGSYNYEECFDERCVCNATETGCDADCKVPCQRVFKARDMDPATYRIAPPASLFGSAREVNTGLAEAMFLPNGTLFSEAFLLSNANRQFFDEQFVTWEQWIKCCYIDYAEDDFAGTKFETCAKGLGATGAPRPRGGGYYIPRGGLTAAQMAPTGTPWEGFDLSLFPSNCALYKSALGLDNIDFSNFETNTVSRPASSLLLGAVC